MVVQHNMSAINANRYFGMNNSKLAGSLEKLSSGYQINRAGDNAAGLAVSEKMRAQIGGLTQATTNAQDGISMIQTFEGALTETDAILQRMRSLAVQSANGTYDDSVDRAALQLEFDQLNDELDNIADTDFNGVIVLNGGTMSGEGVSVDGNNNIIYNGTGTASVTSGPNALGKTVSSVSIANAYSASSAAMKYTSSITLQVGARTKDAIKFTFKYTCETGLGTKLTNDKYGFKGLSADMNCSSKGLATTGLSIATQESANYAIDRVDYALNKVSMVRATFGSIQNRLEHKIDNLNVTNENLTSAESRIRDTDMAKEMMAFTSAQILSQASQSMLAQANSLPQNVLQLLG
ncbi:MAG: flagellin [Oscillospiraceae bacterium]|nr:flagellin [Oscillospiraceae bacterium]